MHHYVKSWPHLFKATVEGRKTADFRDLDERDYKVGDTMTLQEWDPATGEYTGHEVDVEITHIISNRHNPCAMSSTALQKNIGVLSIKLI